MDSSFVNEHDVVDISLDDDDNGYDVESDDDVWRCNVQETCGLGLQTWLPVL